MTWLRWDASYFEHPQVSLMDWQGRVYFWAVCLICKKFEFRGGKVPFQYATAAYVARYFPGMDPAEMDAGRTQAINAGLFEEYSKGWEISGWKRLQKDATGAKRQEELRERKCAESGSGVTEIPVTREMSRCNGDGTGRDGTLQQEEPTSTSAAPKPDKRADDVKEVFDHWMQVMKKRANTKYSPERQSRIRSRLKEGFTVAELKSAIDGALLDSYLVQHNYLGIKTILRDAEQVEKLRDLADAPPDPDDDDVVYHTIARATDEERAQYLKDEAARHARCKPFVDRMKKLKEASGGSSS
jgi:hypothetical protein